MTLSSKHKINIILKKIINAIESVTEAKYLDISLPIKPAAKGVLLMKTIAMHENMTIAFCTVWTSISNLLKVISILPSSLSEVSPILLSRRCNVLTMSAAYFPIPRRSNPAIE
jgi:hypothetical protein